MSRYLFKFYMVLIVALFYSCIPVMVENFIKVQGTIISADDDKYYLDLYTADNKYVQTEFLYSESNESFEFLNSISLTATDVRDVYFIIRNDDRTLQYKTQVYKSVHRIDYYTKPIDLGEITLRRQPEAEP